MRTLLRLFRARRFGYRRLIEVDISRDAILHNLHVFQKKYGVGVAPVLKSNAYGHGLILVGKILDQEDIPFLCVDSFFEATILRNEGVRKPILIIGYTPLENITACKLRNISFAIISLPELERLAASGVSATIHLKFDTGMHRHGIMPTEIHDAIKIIKNNSRITLGGIYSHLADADTENSTHLASQITAWNTIADQFEKAFPNLPYLHCGQTAGSFHSSSLNANTMRLGIGLYGVNSGLDSLDLKPALSMKTRITSTRTLTPGESIGYNATFTATQPMKIASIPVGYNEGLDRRLSNKGVLTVRGIPCPVVGRVSMNITTIDVSNVPDAKLDDAVLVISDDCSAPNSLENMARTCGAIPYELMVHVPSDLHREVI